MKPRTCLNCRKDLVFTKCSRKNKKYCDNICQNSYQNRYNLREKPIPYPKELFEELYLVNKLSISQIAKKLSTNLKKIHRWLLRYEIPRRPFSTKGMKVSLGMKRSLETRKRISESKKGSKSVTWKGGITPYHKKIRNTMELKLWRKSVLERDNKTCQICGIRKEKGMEVDHIKTFARFPELRTSIENGRTLCNNCHLKTDTYGMRTTLNKLF